MALLPLSQYLLLTLQAVVSSSPTGSLKSILAAGFIRDMTLNGTIPGTVQTLFFHDGFRRDRREAAAV